MDPSNAEFLGEKQLVNIVPNFNLDMIYLISGSVGPFRAGLPVKVPIWLAVCLKQKQKCRIIGQEWMDIESLSDRKEMEKMSKYVNNFPKFVAYWYQIFLLIKIILCFRRWLIYLWKILSIRLFTEMPSNHYIDESQILLNVANDDIPDADCIRTSVKVDKAD